LAKQQTPHTFTLLPDDTHRLANLCGQFNEHLQIIERVLGVEIHQRGNVFALYGKQEHTQRAHRVIEELYDDTAYDDDITPNKVQLSLQTTGQPSDLKQEPRVKTKSSNRNTKKSVPTTTPIHNVEPLPLIHTKRAHVKPRNKNQQHYVAAIQKHDISFGVGPAGTGKTYFAVACAVDALLNDKVERLLLVRPAVEAGEKLGFLPGDLAQKVDPYLRPLYDALYEMLGFETVARLIERQVIEIAPLAYMRGRTLNNSFVILDESQNTTAAQMKMFLTRIGFGSTAVITGDTTQIDLPRGTESGLMHACKVLKNVSDISFTHFTSKDVVRHPLVQQIVDAYENYEDKK
jgi:phosphate starvation-inducible PhoH-like protein